MIESRRPPAGDGVAQSEDDFLFHLYRGAELLQDNQVHEAKSELESALRARPKDPRGQDLLAIVYFRLGLYPRAIQIYEGIVDAFAQEPTPRINLGLCYLKTDQPTLAKAQFQQALQIDPNHLRAWGYLGLALQQTGDLEGATKAFERAGRYSMVRRIRAEHNNERPALQPDEPALSVRDWSELRRIAEQAFHELDSDGDAFQLAPPSKRSAQVPNEKWVALEPGQARPGAVRMPAVYDRTHAPSQPPFLERNTQIIEERIPDFSVDHPSQNANDEYRGEFTQEPPSESLKEALQDSLQDAPSVRPQRMQSMIRTASKPASIPSVSSSNQGNPESDRKASVLRVAGAFDSRMAFVFDESAMVTRHPSGAIALSLSGAFIARMDLVRALYPLQSQGIECTTLMRDGDENVPYAQALGGAGSPLVQLDGVARLVMCGGDLLRLVSLWLGNRDGSFETRDSHVDTVDSVFLRESCVAGFDVTLQMDCGRIDVAHGGNLQVIHLHGNGAVLLAFPKEYGMCEVEGGEVVVVHASQVLGWSGGAVPRGWLSAVGDDDNVFSASAGWIRFSGSGVIWMDPTRQPEF